MTKNPKVSIIIPVYNGSNYLKEAIDSALNQTYANVEVIVVNDGSNDNGKTEALAKSYKNRIRYNYKENGGVASALNYGIQKMEGKYFSWLSHDDIYLPFKLEEQINYLRSLDNRAILYSDCELIDSKSLPISIIKLGRVKKTYFLFSLFEYSYLNGCTMLIPKDAFDYVGLFNENLKTTQDYDMFFRLVKIGYKFIHMPIVLLKSRLHLEQVSRVFSKIHKEETNNLYISALNLFSVDEIYSKAKTETTGYLRIAITLEKNNYHDASRYARTLSLDSLKGHKKIYNLIYSVIFFYYGHIYNVFNFLMKLTKIIFKPKKLIFTVYSKVYFFKKSYS